ncbi:MAG TPA: hypothetical protein VGU45_02045 [Microvirga sp.]|jgi:hypothetical protein|nr:hypothetical protein [Microvirga sp.]
MLTVDHLLMLVTPFCRARRISEARLSTLLFNDGKRIDLLRRGGDITSRRLVSAFHWFSNNWPAEAQWPTQVPRPVLEPEAA